MSLGTAVDFVRKRLADGVAVAIKIPMFSRCSLVSRVDQLVENKNPRRIGIENFVCQIASQGR